MSLFRRYGKRDRAPNRRIAESGATAGTNRRLPLRRKEVSAKKKSRQGGGNRRVGAEEGGVPPAGVDRTSVLSSKKRWAVGRLVMSAGRILLPLLSVLVMIAGGIKLYGMAMESAYFSVRFVEITGNRQLSNGEILESAGISMGDSILKLDLSSIEKKLMAQPWIIEATVAKKLPHTVVVEVLEHRETAMVLFDVPYLVDEAGAIFKRWRIGDPIPETIISGIDRHLLAEDQEGVEQIILDAMALMERYKAVGNSRYAEVTEIHKEISGGFSMTVGRDPVYVYIGKPPYRRKLTRLKTLFRQLSKESRQPAIIYLDDDKRPDRVTVKFRDEHLVSQ